MINVSSEERLTSNENTRAILPTDLMRQPRTRTPCVRPREFVCHGSAVPSFLCRLLSRCHGYDELYAIKPRRPLGYLPAQKRYPRQIHGRDCLVHQAPGVCVLSAAGTTSSMAIQPHAHWCCRCGLRVHPLCGVTPMNETQTIHAPVRENVRMVRKILGMTAFVRHQEEQINGLYNKVRLHLQVILETYPISSNGCSWDVNTRILGVLKVQVATETITNLVTLPSRIERSLDVDESSYHSSIIHVCTAVQQCIRT